MNVVYSSSDYYSECTGVSLYSLYNHNREIDINVFIISSDISKENQKRLHDIACIFNKSLTIIDADVSFNKAAEKYHFKKLRGSYNTYSTIILNEWLSFLDKVIVIDSDTLITGSLKGMWNLDIEDYYFAAVPETAMYGKYNYFEDEDIILENDAYFNAGICVVNLKKWREDNIDEYLLKAVKSDNRSYLTSEQSIMNKFLGNKAKAMPLQYNFYSTYHFADYDVIQKIFYKKHFFSKLEYEYAKDNPVIIHYCGFPFERPWFKINVAYRKKEYLQVRSKTPWAEMPLKKWSRRESIFKHLYDVLCYILIKCRMYNTCLKLRGVFAQKVKGILVKRGWIK